MRVQFQNQQPASITQQSQSKIKKHLFLELDGSGSMNDDSKWNALLEGVQMTLDANLSEMDTVSIHKFSSHSDKVINYTASSKDFTLPNLGVANGGTPLFISMVNCFEHIKNNIPKEDYCIVNIVTDGLDTQGYPKGYNQNSLRDLLKELETRKVVITFSGTKEDTKKIVNMFQLSESNTVVHNNTKEGMTRSYQKFSSELNSFSKRIDAGNANTSQFYKNSNND